MSDFDTRRVGEIAVLEERLQHTQSAAAGYKTVAERWQPQFTSEITGDTVKFGVMYAGKRATASYPTKAFAGADATSATTEVLTTMFNNLILDQLRPLIQPEVERMVQAANSHAKVNKW